MKIDAYAHIMTPKYLEALNRYGGAIQLMSGVTALFNLEDRLRVMDNFKDVTQVLVPGATPRNITAVQEAELAKIANEDVAELVVKHPDRFIAAIGVLPFQDPAAMMREAEHAINDLKLKGILISSPIEGRPIDLPELMPLYEMMARADLPIWIHPARPPVPEYKGEDKSKYDMWMLWSWPYESTLAMTRLIFSGVLRKNPGLKVIIHHAGAMVPFFKNRIVGFYNSWQMTGKENHKAVLDKEPIDYFRMFYVDTAIGGNADALGMAFRFYGADHVLFGTDMPYDDKNGYRATRGAIDAINSMDISEADKQKIFEGNARRLLNLK